MKPRVIDLYAGAGLLSGSFKRAGFRSIHAVESDARAVASFNHNVEHVAIVGDVRSVARGMRCETLVAGPPCQGFSTLGKRDLADERNVLSLAIVPWARSTKARVVVVENVPQFLNSPHWQILVKRMRNLGYEETAWVLDAADFGTPQRRTRSFTIFSSIGIPARPAESKCGVLTVRDAFRELPTRTHKDGMHQSPIPSEIARSRFALIPPRGDKRDILEKAPHLCPPSWHRLGAQATDVWGRMNYDKPANTIRCCFQNPSKGRYIHPTADRVITLREGARLQGIPDTWELFGDRTAIARQIGNGVPLPLGYAVAKQVMKLFK